MDFELIMNLWILLCSLVGSIYGILNFFRKKKPPYLQLIASGVGCLMFASLFHVIFLISLGEINEGFHVGFLGIIGSFLFFLTANYGQIDGLVDDRSKTFRVTRIKALLAPVLILVIYVVFFIMVENNELRIVVGIISFFIMICSYYNYKHIIIYDVDLGMVKPLRKYNVLALCYAILTSLEFLGKYVGVEPLYIVSCAGIGIVAVLILPVLKRGVEKWTI